jgi:hypothetical protein
LKFIVIEEVISFAFTDAYQATYAYFFVHTYYTVWSYRQGYSGAHPYTITALVTNHYIKATFVTGIYAYRTLFPVRGLIKSLRASKLACSATLAFFGISSQFLHFLSSSLAAIAALC